MIKRLIISCLLFSTSYGEIVEIQTIESVKNYIKDNTLVFLNVGDTLFAPSSMLSDYKWRKYFVERSNQVLGEEKAASVIDLIKGIIVEKIPKVTPEKVTPSFIAGLQNEKIPVLGYSVRFFSTSYAPNNGKITSQQLFNIGIDLEKTLQFYDAKDYQNEKYVFQYGILFSNKNPVGPAIVDFFQNQMITSNHVILVDNNIKTLKNVEETLSLLNVNFIGLRYSQEDERKKQFDDTIGTIEFLSYMNENKLLTDVEALQVREKDRNVDWESLLDQWILTQKT